MNFIILSEEDASRNGVYELDDDRAEHIRSVLKAAPGDSLQVGIVNGPCGVATVTEVSSTRVVLTIETLSEPPPVSYNVDIICALPRPQTLKKVLAISATMGVRRVFLIRANRVEKSYYHSPLLQPENYRRYLVEGLSQGKNTRLPVVSIHERFRPFFEDELGGLGADGHKGMRLLPDPDANATIADLLNTPSDAATLAIGPEGGWVPFEIELMEHHGFRHFRLGPWVLRVEQALTASLAQLELARLK